MARYMDKAEAAADGFHVVHEPERHRFALYRAVTVDGPREPPGQIVGEAHYSLLGDHTIDFDHTVVIPELRGTGLSAILAQDAVTSDVIGERQIQASCWFIAKYLRRHPELLEKQHP